MKTNKVYREIKRKIPSIFIRKKYDLFEYNTFRIHSVADIFIKVKEFGELLKLVDYLVEKNIKYIVLGKGSNVLLCNCSNKLFVVFDKKYDKIDIDGNMLRVTSSCLINEVVAKCVTNNLKGMEEAIGIPGTIGGAVYMNASAGNFEISKLVDSVVVLENGRIKILKNNDCAFGYRSSIFQKKSAIILDVFLRLERAENYDFKSVINDTILRRKNTQPVCQNSAGSVFKNIGEIKVAKLIDEAGLKGYQIGGAKVSEKHANFIVTNNATCEDVLMLINYIKEKIFQLFGVELETEINII